VKSHYPSSALPLSRLEALLPRWREVPLYRELLAPRNFGVSEPNFDQEFFRLPFITKREMREGFPRNFLRTGEKLEDLLQNDLVEMEHTAGTSEEQTPVFFGRGWWNAQEERALRLNPVVARVLDEIPHARRATLTTPTCNGQACFTNWLSRADRTLGTTLYVNLARIPFLLKEADLARMAAEVAAWAPQFLDVDPVHAVWFALYCEKHGLKFPSLRFILGSYEFVSVVHRHILERVFDVPVFNLYGSTETGHLLMENDRGAMLPSKETAFLEIVDPNLTGVGDLIVTTLSNDYMPLVRYRIGDLVERREQASGSTYVVHGRARDALRRADGQRITTHNVDQCFADTAGIAHYQLRQEDNGQCRLDFVPDQSPPASQALQTLTSRLEAVLQSPAPISVGAVDALPPTPSGKFRLTLQV